MSKDSRGKVIFEEDDSENNSSKCSVQNKIIVEERYGENDKDGEVLDLSFIPCSIPLKKRKISLVNESFKDSNYSLSNFIDFKESNYSMDYTKDYPKDSCKLTTNLRNSIEMDDAPLSLVKELKSTVSPSGGSAKGITCRRPGYITCSICNATKYYSHVQRRFGQYSCEPCSKFMKRFLRDPKIFICTQKGHCKIGKPSGEQEPRGVSVNRCKACWLKICLEKFILDSETRVTIDKFYSPKFEETSNVDNSIAPPLPFPQRKRKQKSETATVEPSKEPEKEWSQDGIKELMDPSVKYREDLNDYFTKIDEKCGNCSHCCPSDEKANVVVIKEACKYMRCSVKIDEEKEDKVLKPLTKMVISEGNTSPFSSEFLTEILNTNSPFL